jgi:hypothetical protein
MPLAAKPRGFHVRAHADGASALLTPSSGVFKLHRSKGLNRRYGDLMSSAKQAPERPACLAVQQR